MRLHRLIGKIYILAILFSNLVNNTPPAVLTMKAIKPKRIISMVWKFKKYLASIVEPTQIPNNIVKILIN